MATDEQHVYRFGDFALVPRERSLHYRDVPVALTGKAFDLLVALVTHAGHLLTKDELLEQVWPGLVVEEVNLSVNVSALRKALAISGGSEWIETVPRQGYRFKGPVRKEDAASVPEPARRRPVRAWLMAAIVGLAGVLIAASLWVGRASRYESVVVLPFQVTDPSGAYLADGLTEGLIDKLAQVPGLRVVPRASAFRFKGGNPVEAGRQLGAAAVITGSLARGESGVNLRLELVDMKRGAPVWNRQYEARHSELPGLQERLALDLGQAVGSGQAEPSGRQAHQVFTGNSEAYQQYLQGRYLWNQRSESALQRSIGHFQRAIELDPDFALAYAALADAHTTLGYLGHVPPVSTFPVARPHALKALKLDPTLAQAHAALAYIKFYFDWDWAGAAEEFRRALELSPNDPVAHQWYAVYLRAAGKADEAQREVETAQRLDPLSLAINTDVGFHHYYAGRYPEAVAQLQTVLAMKKDFILAHLWLARSFLQMGRFEEALAETAHAEQGGREWPVLMTARGFTYGVTGRRDEARTVLREMQQLSSRRFVTAYGMGLVHAGLGEKEEAFAWLEKAFEERSHWLVWLRLDPRWNSLRSDPRFEALVQRMNYPA
jgi:DNA-binding winged helix-turn-helix (wHTH) protein/TolB-like protein/tetratricopeptide (TPR) repeat protein